MSVGVSVSSVYQSIGPLTPLRLPIHHVPRNINLDNRAYKPQPCQHPVAAIKGREEQKISIYHLPAELLFQVTAHLSLEDDYYFRAAIDPAGALIPTVPRKKLAARKSQMLFDPTNTLDPHYKALVVDELAQRCGVRTMLAYGGCYKLLP